MIFLTQIINNTNHDITIGFTDGNGINTNFVVNPNPGGIQVQFALNFNQNVNVSDNNNLLQIITPTHAQANAHGNNYTLQINAFNIAGIQFI